MKYCKECKCELKFTTRNGIKSYLQKKGYCYSCYADIDANFLTNIAKKSSNKIQKEKKENYNWNDTKWLKSEINKECQKIARIIDYGQMCLVNPKENSRCGIGDIQFHGGHLWTKGGHPECKWNLHNIHRQNAGSNNKGSDDVLMFEGIKKEYGVEYYEYVYNLRNKKFTMPKINELQEILKRAKKLSLQLSKNKRIFSATERICLRNKVNEYLAVYDNGIFEIKGGSEIEIKLIN